MSEEAVVKIVLQEEGGKGAASLSPGIPTQPLQHTASLTSPADSIQGVFSPKHKAIHDIFMQSLDDLDAAAKALQALGFAAADIADVRKQLEQEIGGVPAAQSLDTESKTALELARQQQAAILTHKKKEQDLEATKTLGGVRKQQTAATEGVEPAFDPTAEARRRYEREQQKKAIDAEYERLFGEAQDAKTWLDSAQEIAGGLRGVFGSTIGSIIGGIVDVAVAVENARESVEDIIDGGTSGGTSATQKLADGASKVSSSISSSTTQNLARGSDKSGISSTTSATQNLAKGSDKSDTSSTTSATQNLAKGSSEVSGTDSGASGATGKAGKAAKGGGASKAMAAAGPILAVAGAIKEVIDEINAAVIGGIRSTIGAVSGVAMFAADPGADPSVPLGKLGNAASQAGEKIAGIVPMVGYLGVAVGETISAFSGLMQSLDKTAERYAEYSGQISQVQAIAEIRQTMGDFRRAQEVSREMSKYLMAQSDLQQKFEDIKVKALVKILPAVTRILEVVESIMPAAEGVGSAIELLASPIKLIADAAAEFVNLKRDEKQPDIKSPTELLQNMMFETLGSGTDKDPGWVPRL